MPPDSGGGAGDYSGIYIPNPYDGEADLNNPNFMLAGNVAAFTSTLPNNLRSLTSTYPWVFPYMVDYFRDRGGVNTRNGQNITTALTNFYDFQNNLNLPNWTFVTTERFKFWAFIQFLNHNPGNANTESISDIKNSLLATTPEIAQEITDFLFDSKDINSKKYSAFIDEAINALTDGTNVNFDELYIEEPTPDDNYVYLGQKEFIPSTLILANGNEVAVTFGTTKDNKNANNEVAVELINALKSALNSANNNLPPSEKITSIHIMATTNGKHNSNNHYNGSAADISRINGVKMITSGVTSQIIKLQEAFDNFAYIRENFGPHFKHKYSIETNTWNYNHNVKGHKDHIHISVRKL